MLDDRSLARLKGVNLSLQHVTMLAHELSELDFIVTEGRRSLDRQKSLVAFGASQTLNSKHLKGLAVDVAARIDGEIRWDWPLYHKLNKAFQRAAATLGIAIVWGGDWKKFPDGPHFELRDG